MSSFFIDSENRGWSTGYNGNYELGLGNSENKNHFEIIKDHKFKSIFHGHTHTIAIDEEGYIWGVGSNKGHQLGQDDTKYVTKFKKIPIQYKDTELNFVEFVKFSLGFATTIALDISGYIWVLGDNTFRQLGVGDRKKVCELTKLDYPNNIIDISTYLERTIALDNIGNIWMTGHCGDFSEIYTLENSIEVFTKFDFNKDFIALSSGPDFITILDADGNIWGMGCNNMNQLGKNNISYLERFLKITESTFYIEVCCGDYGYVALDDCGNIWVAGRVIINPSVNGILTKLEHPSYFINIYYNANTLLALDNNGKLWSAGDNFKGSLGLYDELPRKILTQVELNFPRVLLIKKLMNCKSDKSIIKSALSII